MASTFSVCFASRSSSVSPTQTIGLMDAACAACVFLRHQRVRFLLILPPLRMAQNHVAYRKFLEHSRRDLAGVRAEMMLAHVLRAEADVGMSTSFDTSPSAVKGGHTTMSTSLMFAVSSFRS